MAQPIRFQSPPRDVRAELVARVAAAPAEHAEALLAAYDVLQGLHDRGVLDLLRGALGSSDALVEMASTAADAPQSIRAVRNLMLLASTLAAIEPELLCDVTRAIPVALEQARHDEARPPGLFKLLSTFLDADFRRGLAAGNNLFIALGRNLAARCAS
jgi:uncharacterized protein YjgD (DUF1641 family)